MSWFTEIAGKAEDLLNKVDKTAATALQNKTKFGSSSDIRVKSNYPVTPFVESTFHGISPKQPSAAASTPNVANLKNPKTFSKGYSTPRNKPESDDEKLLQFLNSSEPIPKTPEKSVLPEENVIEPVPQPMPPSPPVSFEQNVIPKATQHEQQKVSETHIPESPAIEEQQLEQSSASVEILSFEESIQQQTMKCDDPSNMAKENPLTDVSDVTTLKEELLLASKRAEHAQSEMKRMQKKLEHWNSQISGNDKFVRELQEREKDLTAALDAKDSQLAVLKVRLEEADQEIQNKRAILEGLKAENEKLVKNHSDEITMYNQMVDSLRLKLVEVETECSKCKEAYHSAQTEHMVRQSKLEEEQRHLVENVTNCQRKWSELNDRNKELVSQIQNSNRNLENLQHEYADYKQKAQRILQSKEKLILSLKEGNFDMGQVNVSEPSYAVLSAEADGIKQERDLLREELRQANETVEALRNEVQEIEKISQTDCETARQHCRNVEEQLRQERLLTEEVQLLNTQLKEEMQFLREELQHTKSSLLSRIQDRESEIEKLRKQLTAKSMSTVSQDELESRLHALTENLIQKQTIVEALSTEKNSLVLQLERLELQLKEAQHYGSQLHTVVGLSNSDNDRKQKPVVFLENPFDSTLTRKVKRMYGGIDAFSIRLGVFFRRYPIARVFIIMYMLLLHLWVMIVLLTYEPEIHNTSYKIVNNA